jgi:uroporphyrinogen decarboxylase
MRQASRYFPEYRELRQRRTYRDICTTPELAAEAAHYPVRRFGLDAGILFTDPLLFLEGVGAAVEFTDTGPIVADPIRSRNDLERLDLSDGCVNRLPYLSEAVSQTAAALGDVPLIAVSGGPYTLAGYLVEGRNGRSQRYLKSLLFNDPHAAGRLMEAMADLSTEMLIAQFEAGARAFILYDSWAGALTLKDYRTHVAPYVTDVIRRLQMYRRPGTLYVNGAGHLLDALVRTDIQVIGVDWRVDLEVIRTRLPENVSIQGNLDPALLLGPPDLIRQRALDILIQGTLYRGHVFNLGGGILPGTPPENVQVLVDVIRDFDPSLQGWRSVRP